LLLFISLSTQSGNFWLHTCMSAFYMFCYPVQVKSCNGQIPVQHILSNVWEIYFSGINFALEQAIGLYPRKMSKTKYTSKLSAICRSEFEIVLNCILQQRSLAPSSPAKVGNFSDFFVVRVRLTTACRRYVYYSSWYVFTVTNSSALKWMS